MIILRSQPQDPKLIDSEKQVKALYSKLEKEFKAMEKEATKKIKEAAQSLLEANKLANKFNVNLNDMYDAIRPLLSAMDKAGWNTSSFNC